MLSRHRDWRRHAAGHRQDLPQSKALSLKLCQGVLYPHRLARSVTRDLASIAEELHSQSEEYDDNPNRSRGSPSVSIV